MRPMLPSPRSRPALARPVGARLAAAVGLVSLSLSACIGGGSSEAVAPTPTPAPTVAPTPPADEVLAFSDETVQVAIDDHIRVVPGENVELVALVHNATDRESRFALLASSSDDLGSASAMSSTMRIPARGVAEVSIELDVELAAVIGDTYELRFTAALRSDATRQSQATTTVEVVAADGERPEAGRDTAVAPNSDQTTAFVVLNDTDPDSDIRFDTVTILGGGFRARSVTANANGTVVYVPFNDVSGTDVVLYEVCDEENRCDAASLTITIEPAVTPG